MLERERKGEEKHRFAVPLTYACIHSWAVACALAGTKPQPWCLRMSSPTRALLALFCPNVSSNKTSFPVSTVTMRPGCGSKVICFQALCENWHALHKQHNLYLCGLFLKPPSSFVGSGDSFKCTRFCVIDL